MLLEGDSCNVVVVPGPTGLLLIDDQRDRDYAATVAALKTMFSQPVVEVINTHWHLDHAGGNAAFARAGAVILAQRNVASRLSMPQFMAAYNANIAASPAMAWPTRLYDATMTVRFGQERVLLVHIDHAHTDGDTLVKLTRANVLHMGDVFFNGLYPFIDLSSGGSVQGLIRAVDEGIRLSDARTKVVPGHGTVTNRAALFAYRAMLADVDRNVRRQMAAGTPRAEIIASRPAATYALEGDADRFVAAIYDSYRPEGHSTGSEKAAVR
ncbi:MAG: MBL fold metallo-hydrolase [Sphingomonas sp.]|uniref:MBL fold metallo-hydrolase n=1 Tax=Sphingomonas sp. TaxID=28214 RepID=UPI0035695DC9